MEVGPAANVSVAVHASGRHPGPGSQLRISEQFFGTKLTYTGFDSIPALCLVLAMILREQCLL